MSKFNRKISDVTKNNCGFEAYAMTDKEKLVSEVLNSFFGEAKYYGDTSAGLKETAIRLLGSDPRFVSNLARYARREMHLRSVSHVLAALIAHEEKGKPFIRETVLGVVERPDDITEILAYYLNTYGKPLPNGLKKALADALRKFSQFEISKYSGGNRAVKFRDVLRLTHAKPQTPEEDALFSAIMHNTLPKAERWENALSEKGNTKEVWEKLIEENKLGYMAALRNLRNLLIAAPDNLDRVLALLSDEKKVRESKQLPMRFFSAYLQVAGLPACTSRVLDALESAIGYSVANMPRLPGKTVIAIDTSASMESRLSARSVLRCCDVARLLAALASRLCDEYAVFTFDTRILPVTFSKHTGIIEAANSIPLLGGCTNVKLPLEQMLNGNVYADRLLLFSDNEINWTKSVFPSRSDANRPTEVLADEYREKINPDLWVHAVDLAGYGTQQFRGPRTNYVSGWSERILEYFLLAEQGLATQVQAVENYKG